MKSLSLLTLSLFTSRSYSLSSSTNFHNSIQQQYNTHSLSIVASQLSYCHTVLEQTLHNNNHDHVVIDATCGNGWDSLKLAELCLTDKTGLLYCIDVNSDAIKRTYDRLKSKIIDDNIFNNRIKFCCQSHENFPIEIKKETVSIIIYNLGYLPNSFNSKITCADITVKSIIQAISLLKIGGTCIITSYIGHPGGLEENIAVEQLLRTLDSNLFRVTKNVTINQDQEKAPLLYTIYRKKWPMKPLRT